MDNRYSLRFESGERKGETIPIGGSGFTIGRKPGNSLQILDNSVSGNHAAIDVDAQGVLLRDLGSTNGTRVGDQRVLETHLAHGDVITFGNVRMSFGDAALGAAPGASASAQAASTPATPADGVVRVSQEDLARSGKRSRKGLLLVAALALAGGGLWFQLNHAQGSSGTAVRPVTPVAGDLFADEFSFEGDHDSWSPGEGSPTAFLKSEKARYSGSFGMGCELGDGEWALHRSKEARCDADRELTARATVRAASGIEMRLGIEFSAAAVGDAAAPGPFTAWSRAAAGASGFTPLELSAPVPPGYSSARICVLARARAGTAKGSAAAFDDASLVMRAASVQPAAQIDQNRLYVFGDPPATALLFKVNRVLISNLAAQRGDAADDDAHLITVASSPTRIDIAPPAARWSLRAEAPLAHGRIATIAGGAYQTHAADFTRDGVQTLLLGSGDDLVSLKISSPARVTGAADGAASLISIQCSSDASLAMQLDFKEEKTQAGSLAYAARNAEKKGDLGACLKGWNELLNSYPYEEGLVAEAEATRGRLVQKGLEELRGVRTEIERARFFRLVDLYRQCRAKAQSVGSRYAGSEVETEAKNVEAEVDVDLVVLEADLSKNERTRLSAILATLEQQNATGLAGEVRAYLDAHFAEKH
jgi:hypothetical protein